VPETVVLDTNIVLDVFVFDDAAARPVKQGLEAGTLRWVATSAMRDELERVLAYPQIVSRLAFYQLLAADVLAAFDHHSDADDQKFIDLAVAHRALLLSKDRAVLVMRKRLEALHAGASTAWQPSAMV
jgi:predicted nucleic acid-binding protein